MVRAGTVGTHPRFVRMIRELIVERIEHGADRAGAGHAWARATTSARPIAVLHRATAARADEACSRTALTRAR